MNFSPEIALAYARAITRPRRVGSGADEAVAQEVTARLEQFGCRVERQPFEFSTAPSIFIALEILASQSLILAIFWAWGAIAWASLLLALLLLSLILLVDPLNRAVRDGSLAPHAGEKASRWSRLCLRVGRRYRAVNLVATWLNLPEDPTLPCLYLLAHYDSKSQRLPLVARITLFVVAGLGAAAFVGLTLLRDLLPALTPLATALGLVAWLSSVPLLFLQEVGNASPGAIDDASGVGLALHLAEYLGQRQELRDKLQVKILLTNAEEMGVMGAAAYVRAHERRLRDQAGRVHFLNFDGIGVQGVLYFAGGSAGQGRLLHLIRQVCGELGMPLGRFALPGALFDHIPFVERGLDALTLMMIGRASWWVHTPHDSADKLHVEGFRQAGEVAIRVIEKLAAPERENLATNYTNFTN